MTTQEVANRFHELAQTFQWEQIQKELYSDEPVSIEAQNPMGGPLQVQGREALQSKMDNMRQSMEEFFSGYSKEPLVAGPYFSVAMGMDVTMKGMGRIQMDEIAVYEVRDGKIVKEQFFY